MSSIVRSIDHPVIAVRDMGSSRQTYERLGFRIPPLGNHLEWGTGNWCIMFPSDYLELRGIADPSRYTHNLDTFLDKRGEGLMGVAFAPTDSSDASYHAARDKGFHPSEVKNLTRRFALPDGDSFPRFRLIYLDEAELPELLTSVVCQHLTPELIRRPDWLDHPNGVTGVISMTCVVEDPETIAPVYQRLLGEAAFSSGSGRLVCRLARGAEIEFLNVGEALSQLRLVEGTQLPTISSLTLGVQDVEVTARVLSENKVDFDRQADGSLRVPPEFCCGVIIFFSEGGAK